MSASSRTQNALLAALTAAAIGASGFAVWSVRQPHPSTAENDSAPGVSESAAGVTSTPSEPAASDEGDGPGADRAATTSTPADINQPTESTARVAADLDGWLDAWSEESDLLVIGDGLSHRANQWVHLWAVQIGRDRPVQIHHWGEREDVAFNDARVLSERSGPELTVWSASRRGSTIQDAADRYDRFVDESATPDAVLVTLGLSSANEDIDAGLDDLVGQIDEDIPVLILVGPEGLYRDGVGDDLLSWAEDNDDRVAVLDLRPLTSYAPTAEGWAREFYAALQDD